MQSAEMDESQKRARQLLMTWVNGGDLDVQPREPKPTFDANLRLLGQAWYGQLCTPCHGPKGDGNGMRAGQLSPRPRDFTQGLYEFRSTRSGALPTDEDLWKVISNGLHGTAMVPWLTLAEFDRWALVAYVETLSPRFATEPRQASTFVPKAPAITPDLIAKGHTLFSDAGCIECHGVSGLGDGPAVPTLTDAKGRPIRPLDFPSGVLRRGSSIEDIFLTIQTGLDGTPMPSYATALSEDQTWAVAAYVHSLIAEQPGSSAKRSEAALAALQQERFGMMIDMPGMGRLPMSHAPR